MGTTHGQHVQLLGHQIPAEDFVDTECGYMSQCWHFQDGTLAVSDAGDLGKRDQVLP